MIKICGICGKKFKPQFGRKYCSVRCREEAVRRRSREQWRKCKNSGKKKVKQTKKEDSKLSDIAKKARENGMSYGKYKAMQYMENARIKL